VSGVKANSGDVILSRGKENIHHCCVFIHCDYGAYILCSTLKATVGGLQLHYLLALFDIHAGFARRGGVTSLPISLNGGATYGRRGENNGAAPIRI